MYRNIIVIDFIRVCVGPTFHFEEIFLKFWPNDAYSDFTVTNCTDFMNDCELGGQF